MYKLASVLALTTAAGLAHANDVNPDVIFGSGNANGAFTIGTGSGIELGLRAKLRYNTSGQPENTFNYDGVDTYRFDPANGNAPANRAMWNFEWSVNSDVNGSTGNNLDDFYYELAMFRVNTDGTNPADALIFDPINVNLADHAIGDNNTGNGAGTVAANDAAYATLIGSNNVAQNSWNYGFFTGLTGWDPSDAGNYIIRLTAMDASGNSLASTSINVAVVPLPPAAWAGLGLLGAVAGVRAVRRR